MAGKIRELLTALSVCEKQLQRFDKLIDEYPKQLEENLNEIGRQVVAEWYASYEPNIYDRQRSLYKAFKVVRNGLNVDVRIDARFMAGYSHRATNKFILENSFIGGFHGGADKISEDKVEQGRPPHPNPGTPYWRNAADNYASWGDKAEKSFSPYEVMMERMQEEIDKSGKAFITELKDIRDRILRTINAYIKTISGGGKNG